MLYCVLENQQHIAYQSLYSISLQCNEYGNFHQIVVHQYSVHSLAIFLTLFSFSLKVLQPLMAIAGDM